MPWDRFAKRFDKPASDDDEAIARARTWLQPDMRVLEIGCAAGATAEVLAPMVASWHGIDISEEMIERAKARTNAATFQQAVVEEIDGQFDAVVAFNVLHFLQDWNAVTARVKPGGLLIAQTPCLGDLWYQPIFPVIAFVLRLPGLRRIKFSELKAELEGTVLEEDDANPAQTWLVMRVPA